jgi:hypothetical protein
MLTLTLSLNFLAINVADASQIGDSIEEYSWPMLQHDPEHTGYSMSPVPNTNNTLWIYDLENVGMPVVADGKVFVGLRKGYKDYLHALEESTGELIWSYETRGVLVIAYGKVFVASWGGGRLYAFGGPPPTLTVYTDGIPPESPINVTFNDRSRARGGPIIIGTASDTSPLSIPFYNNIRAEIGVSWEGAWNPSTMSKPIFSGWSGEATGFNESNPVFIFLKRNSSCVATYHKTQYQSDITLDIKSTAAYLAFRADISGRLTIKANNTAIVGADVKLEYTTTNGETWTTLTQTKTNTEGVYSASWWPAVTGDYIIRASWDGNETYCGVEATSSLSVTPYAEKYVFSVSSNSTVSALAFNSTSRELSFTVTGPSGTTGYVNVHIAKTLVENIADVKVYLDGNQLDYTVTSLDDSWLLHFTYGHSTHIIAISLGLVPFIPPQLITPLSLGILAVVLAVATTILIFKIRRGTPSTILNGVFNKSK